ncbi:phosphotransferase [Paenibacillus mendelii]|uniref:Phosphotransferase n=1 Tax=Paenibacillus mendelii TaxID=206163 RepID=A0ABV6J353_9BACL|nr:phosphotransferase [Paenibacillus mendelii]MCQ6562801.1 phosphotransferase [Paenibacillus mendelii]
MLIHLKNDGIRVVEPVMRNDSSYILELNAIEGKRFGILFHAVEGEEGLPTDLIQERFGSYVAEIHNSLDKITSPINRWHLDTASFIDKSMAYLMRYSTMYAFDYQFLFDVASETKKMIETRFPKTMPEYGLCHGDLYSGNVRMDSSGNLTVFDFDLCGYGWRAYDISLFICSFGLGVDAAAMDIRERKKEVFLNGYLKNRNLSEVEIHSIYLFAPFRRLFNIGSLYAFFAESWGHDIFFRNVEEEITLLKDWVNVYKF